MERIGWLFAKEGGGITKDGVGEDGLFVLVSQRFWNWLSSW